MQTTPAINRLSLEQSPYLKQHATNPVDWYPWSQEALAKAEREDKPLLISVGYSACHWCHVMAEESFSDPEIAELLNEYFVSIKVDREERPDIDLIYQEACHLLTRSGGWPLTVFATPSGKPFYAGTYFPPETRWGRAGFKELVEKFGETYRTKKEELVKLADQLTDTIREAFTVRNPAKREGLGKRLRSVARAGRNNLSRHLDWENGGFGGAPKFPSVPCLELFWAGDEEHRQGVVFTLEKMIAGGIYDQVGGGFHRYAKDERWLIPHFEKMLYDNALLVQLMSKVYQETKYEMVGEAVKETVQFVLREMTGPNGEFYASLDADSAGREGAYYVWSLAEIEEELGAEEAARFADYFDVTSEGNFEDGKSVLSRKNRGLIPKDLEPALEKLAKARLNRERPFRDEKVLTAWNGLMISALALASAVLGEPKYVEAAEKNVEFILANLTTEDGRLLRSFLDRPGRLPGYSEDYAFLVAGLLDLYEVTNKALYLQQALEFQERLVADFYDPEMGGFYLVSEPEDLIVRPKENSDGTLPSATGIALLNLLRLREAGKEPVVRSEAILEDTLALYLNSAAENPWGYATLLRAAEYIGINLA